MWSRQVGTIQVGQIIRTNLLLAACVGLFAIATTVGHAQTIPAPAITTNPSSSLTLPQQPEMPVSPTTPGTLPGTTAPNIAVGTNPITGAPCLGGGASAINGGVPGAPTASNQPAEPGQAVNGLAPNTSIYSLNNQTPNSANPGTC
jgi:hypothetical protein